MTQKSGHFEKYHKKNFFFRSRASLTCSSALGFGNPANIDFIYRKEMCSIVPPCISLGPQDHPALGILPRIRSCLIHLTYLLLYTPLICNSLYIQYTSEKTRKFVGNIIIKKHGTVPSIPHIHAHFTKGLSFKLQKLAK